ncbi:outer membrane lipoprotein-sorting protein [Desulfonema ishimotonii]|uniref:Outer membrane lipoprotein-sorting protein n=1 Tax=Desulfonema ishimotonii TaxID=45657 RepID=A0A401FXT8_9BACT|nr:outer membrane lipoprotein-sorting protein [Desulfonema ishimotonii]GBC61775.1 outer membrane lipoprotein-sorting protein [Desulfonema ishimotonii]
MLKKMLMCAGLFLSPLFCLSAAAQDADKIVRDSFNYMRGKSSVSTVVMTIRRPDWKREMSIRGWTRGEKESLFFITSPPRDKGNGTLKKGREMWTYNPKINRVIKLPPSMMSQAWMGSDFSNNDLAKSDSLIYDYVHTLEGTETHEGKTVWVIRSMPEPDAPVIWGMQRLKIREDYVLLMQAFYDEDLEPVKILTGSDIQMMSGRMFPRIMKMHKADAPEDEYTVLEYRELEFKDHLPDNLFTLSALRTSRR